MKTKTVIKKGSISEKVQPMMMEAFKSGYITAVEMFEVGLSRGLSAKDILEVARESIKESMGGQSNA